MTSPDYGAILKRSWELTWKNKWLWVYGLVLAAMGAGGNYSGSGSSGSSSSSSSSSSTLQKNINSQTVEQGQKVLGAATDALTQWVNHVPIGTWVLLVVGVVVIILLGLIINTVVQAWAKGALISALEEADSGVAVTLKSLPPRGLNRIKQMIIFGVITGVMILGVIFVALLLILVGLILFSGNSLGLTIWITLVAIVGVVVFLIAAIVVTAVSVWAERLIVLFGMDAWAAWKKGLSLTKKGFLHQVVMGLINGVVSCAVGCLSLIVLAILVGVPAFILVAVSIAAHSFSPVIVAFLAIMVILAIFINLLVRAVVVVFNYGNWNLFFKQAIAQEETEVGKMVAGTESQVTLKSGEIAGVALRVMAGAIDLMISLVVLLFAVNLMVANSQISAFLDGTLNALVVVILVLPIWGLVQVLATSKLGGTVGKLICGLKVVDEEGKQVSFSRGFLRQTAGYMASGVLLWAGFLWIFKDSEKRGWHDQIAGTWVVVASKAMTMLGLVVVVGLLIVNVALSTSIIKSLGNNMPAYQSFVQAWIKEMDAQKKKTAATQQVTSGAVDQKELARQQSFNKLTNEAHDADASKKYTEELAKGQEALELAKSSEEKAIAYYWIGLADYRLGDLRQAEFELRQATTFNQSYSAPYVTLSAIAGQAGRKQESLNDANLAVKYDDKSAWAHNSLALALYALGRKSEAIAEFQKALALDPTNAILKNNLLQAQRTR